MNQVLQQGRVRLAPLRAGERSSLVCLCLMGDGSYCLKTARHFDHGLGVHVCEAHQATPSAAGFTVADKLETVFSIEGGTHA